MLSHDLREESDLRLGFEFAHRLRISESWPEHALKVFGIHQLDDAVGRPDSLGPRVARSGLTSVSRPTVPSLGAVDVSVDEVTCGGHEQGVQSRVTPADAGEEPISQELCTLFCPSNGFTPTRPKLPVSSGRLAIPMPSSSPGSAR